jgi:hypothetical protein
VAWFANRSLGGTPGTPCACVELSKRHSRLVSEKTIPLTAAALALQDGEAVARCAVRLGHRVEVDMVRLREAFGAEAALRVERYWDAARKLWADGSGPAIVITRTLHQAAQKDSKAGRVELVDELAALEELRNGGALVDALLGPEVDPEALRGHALQSVGNETYITITRRSTEWPASLGGPPIPGELRRHVRVVANHSKWRDRKVRRLVRVEVTAEEVWPDPATVD